MPTKTKKSVPTRITKSTQTEEAELESSLEIARLQEQIKLLHIQIRVLKDHSSNESTRPTWLKEVQLLNTPGRRVSLRDGKIIVKGCHCKGNCSSLKCGCVKKDFLCQESCKCNHKKCENKELKPEEGDAGIMKENQRVTLDNNNIEILELENDESKIRHSDSVDIKNS